MKNTNRFVNISNKWFADKEDKAMINTYGSDSLLIYALLLRNLNHFRGEISFSIEYLCNKLKVKQTNGRMIKKVKNILTKINNKLIEVYQDDNIKTETFEYNKFYSANILIDIPKDNYFKLFDKDIDKLLNYITDTNIDKFEISTYLMFLLSCMGNKENTDNYKVCYPSIEYSANKCNILEGNILRYNKILEDAKIIAIDNAGMNKNKENDFKNVTNTYARYEDIEILKQSVEKQREKVTVAIDYNGKKELQNRSRSKAKEISIWKKEHDLYNLSEKEFNELYSLEKEHYNIRYMICNSKIHINGGYVTLYPTKRGMKKDYNNYVEYVKEEI